MMRNKSSDTNIQNQEASGGIQSLDAALRVLLHIANLPGASGLSDIARACNMPPSKVHRYLASFVHADLIQQNGRSGTYDLGLAAQSVGLAALARRDIVNTVSDSLREFTEMIDCTTLLSVWSDSGPTVVRWQRAPSPTITSLGLGTTFPLLSSATGRVFYAFSPDALVKRHIANELKRSQLSPVILGDLKEGETPKMHAEQIRQSVRKEGMATVDGRFIPGLVAIAVPILNWQDEADVVVTVIGSDPKLIEPDSDVVLKIKQFAIQFNSTPK
ncbi:MAG: IclR family transcriptional regulator [Nitratireductor sp.]